MAIKLKRLPWDKTCELFPDLNPLGITEIVSVETDMPDFEADGVAGMQIVDFCSDLANGPEIAQENSFLFNRAVSSIMCHNHWLPKPRRREPDRFQRGRRFTVGNVNILGAEVPFASDADAGSAGIASPYQSRRVRMLEPSAGFDTPTDG